MTGGGNTFEFKFMCEKNTNMDFFFRYYENQRKEIHERAKERMSMAFQMLIMAATATVAYTRIGDSVLLKIVLGLFVIALGVVGFVSNRTKKKAIDAHIKRARKARSNIKGIDSIAKFIEVNASVSEAKQYSCLHIMVMIYGVILSTSALL